MKKNLLSNTKHLFLSFTLKLLLFSFANAQLTIPNGVSGISSSPNGHCGLGTTSPSLWFGGSVALDFYATRPVLKLNNTNGMSTITFTSTQVNASTHTGEMHMNYSYNSTNPPKSTLKFDCYPQQGTLVLTADGNIGIGTTPNYKLDVIGDINFTGNLLKNGQPFATGGSSPWTVDGSNNISYNLGKVGIGTSVVLI
jgi:hypothetical protein